MFVVNDFEDRIVARLLDFFSERAPWHRRLWDIGSILALEELEEAATAAARQTLSEAAVTWLRSSHQTTFGRDEALDAYRTTLQRALTRLKGFQPQSEALLLVRHVLEAVRSDYLMRWAAVLKSQTRPQLGAERVARYIGAHLLDAGFSPTFLHRWLTRCVHDERAYDIAAWLEEAQALVTQPQSVHDVIVPFAAGAPGAALGRAPMWIGSHAVKQWLDANESSNAGLRPSGAIQLALRARDPYAAGAAASERVETILSRITMGARTDPGFKPYGKLWVRGWRDPIDIRQLHPRDSVHELERTAQLLGEVESSIDTALELLGTMNGSAAGPAVANGWAAIETLLSAPGDSERVVAGDRVALLVAASFARAELTTLANRIINDRTPMGARIRTTSTNRARAEIVAEAILAQEPLPLRSGSDLAAHGRMAQLLAQPLTTLSDVRAHASRTFRRLYRQRNLVMHSGATGGIVLRATRRTAAPLIGAAFDRVANAVFVGQESPLEVVVRASVRLEHAKQTGRSDPHTLLTLLERTPPSAF